MVEIKFGARQSPSAILTGVVVTRVDIKSREAHMPLRHTFISNKQQYAWNAYKSSDYPNLFVINFYREVAPTGEVKGAILLVYCARHSLIQQCESALNGGYVYG